MTNLPPRADNISRLQWSQASISWDGDAYRLELPHYFDAWPALWLDRNLTDRLRAVPGCDDWQAAVVAAVPTRRQGRSVGGTHQAISASRTCDICRTCSASEKCSLRPFEKPSACRRLRSARPTRSSRVSLARVLAARVLRCVSGVCVPVSVPRAAQVRARRPGSVGQSSQPVVRSRRASRASPGMAAAPSGRTWGSVRSAETTPLGMCAPG